MVEDQGERPTLRDTVSSAATSSHRRAPRLVGLSFLFWEGGRLNARDPDVAWAERQEAERWALERREAEGWELVAEEEILGPQEDAEADSA